MIKGVGFAQRRIPRARIRMSDAHEEPETALTKWGDNKMGLEKEQGEVPRGIEGRSSQEA